MKTSHFALLTLVLGLALGFGAGSILGGPTAAAAPPPALGLDHSLPSESPGSGSGSIGSGLVGVSPQALPTETEGDRSRGSKPISQEARSAARSAIRAQVSTDEDAALRTHSIRGVIVDADGAPMPGVQVVGHHLKDGKWPGRIHAMKTTEVGRAWKGHPDVETTLAKNADDLLARRRGSSVVASDAMGSFTLKELREGIHIIQAYADGFEFKAQRIHTGRDCTFVAAQVFVIELDLRLPNGTQPAEAVISPTGPLIRSNYAWSPEEPRLRLTQAAVELVARSGNVQRLDWRMTSSEFTSAPYSFNLELDGPGPYVVELAANQILRVTLEDDSKMAPKLPVWVKVAPIAAAEGIDWSDEVHSPLTLAPDGDYQLLDAPKGRYLLAAGRGEGGRPEVTEEITIELGVTEASLHLGEVDTAEFLIVHCQRDSGLAIDDASFAVERERARFSPRVKLAVTKRSRGEYWLSKGQLFPVDVEGPQHLSVTSPIEGKVTVPLDASKDELTVTFEPACSIHLVVNGDLAAGYSVMTKKRGEDNQPAHAFFSPFDNSAQKIQEGRPITLAGLQPGVYDVHLFRTGHGQDAMSAATRSKKVLSEEVTVEKGEVTVEVTIPSSHSVRVHAPNVAADSTLSLVPKGGSRYRDGVDATVGADAMAKFDQVLAGDYTLSVKSSRDSIEITVPCGEVQFDIKLPDCFRVSSVEAEGAAALAGFKKGDLIIAVDGAPVQGNASMAAVMKAVRTGSVRMTVERPTGTLDLTLSVSPKADGKPGSMGMRFAPHARD